MNIFQYLNKIFWNESEAMIGGGFSNGFSSKEGCGFGFGNSHGVGLENGSRDGGGNDFFCYYSDNEIDGSGWAWGSGDENSFGFGGGSGFGHCNFSSGEIFGEGAGEGSGEGRGLVEEEYENY